MASNVADPAKVFNFIIEINGVDSWAVQEFTPPELSIEAVAHGGANSDIKTAGRVSVGDASFNYLKPLPTITDEAYDWFKRAQDIQRGGGQLSSVYKKIAVVRELYPDNVKTAGRWILTGAWVSGISQNAFSRTSSDNILRSVTLTVDDVEIR